MKAYFRRISNRFPALPIGTFIGMLHLLIAIVGAGVITLFSLYFIYINGQQANLRDLKDLASIVETAIEQPVASYLDRASTFADIETAMNGYLHNRSEVRYALLHAEGSPFPSPALTRALSGVTAASPEVRQALTGSVSESIHKNAQGQDMIYAAAPIQRRGEIVGVLVMAVPRDLAMQPTYQTMRWLIVIAAFIVLFTVGEGWLGSIYISRPLVRLSQVAEKLSQGDMSARAEITGPAEVMHLARTLNEMATRVQNSLDSMRAFVANASHELRTPLTSIKLQVGVVRDVCCTDTAAAQRFMEQIDSEINRLSRLVNEMLDLSQLEGGGSRLKFQPVNMTDLAEEVQAFWHAHACHAGLSLTFDTEPNLPLVNGDPYQLRRLMDNLLDNAIKYTPPGGKIEISLRHCPPPSGRRAPDVVRLEVSDNGQGIALEHLPHLFDRFYRIEAHATAGKPKGSGLGLAIARSIVRAHGGQIGVNSMLGEGSTFWVELPVDAK